MKKNLLFFFLAITLNSCFLFEKRESPTPTPVVVIDPLPSFNTSPQIYNISNNKILESSGLVVSRGIPNAIWVEEDSDNPAGLHLISTTGNYIKFYPYTQNRDCEDIAIGAGPITGKNYIYLADIGDNNATYGTYYIYRFLEPSLADTKINSADIITYKYSDDKSYNAETLLLDPITKDLYVITKNEFNVKVFRLKYPQDISNINIAEYLGTIPYYLVTGGDISSDGTEILIKSYFGQNYWKIKSGETIFQTLSRTRDIGLPYIEEPQGEAIGWDLNTKGFYTLSENGGSIMQPPLYYYTEK